MVAVRWKRVLRRRHWCGSVGGRRGAGCGGTGHHRRASYTVQRWTPSRARCTYNRRSCTDHYTTHSTCSTRTTHDRGNGGVPTAGSDGAGACSHPTWTATSQDDAYTYGDTRGSDAGATGKPTAYT